MRLEPTADTNDFLSTPTPWMMLGAIALPFLMLAVGLVAIYFGVEYAVPGWNVHSVPPPRLY